jgi:signal transduction histidine kinase
MIEKKKLPSLKLIAVFLWLTLSLALAGWWLLFGLNQLDKIAGLQNASARDILRQHRMLMSEGGFLFGLLLVGGVSLLYYISSEIRRAKQIQTFFAAFTHDLKTSLASLRLQAESLEEELDQNQSKFTKRIIRDTVRLELQLNNSLNLAQDQDNTFFIEDLSLKKSLEIMQYQWADFDIQIINDCILRVDAKALESICKNIIQNSIIHGQSRHLKITCQQSEVGMIQIEFQDDGQGFQGELRELGELFVRHSNTSGTGIGLYLVKNLCVRMKGRFNLVKLTTGFKAVVLLPGQLL